MCLYDFFASVIEFSATNTIVCSHTARIFCGKLIFGLNFGQNRVKSPMSVRKSIKIGAKLVIFAKNIRFNCVYTTSNLSKSNFNPKYYSIQSYSTNFLWEVDFWPKFWSKSGQISNVCKEIKQNWPKFGDFCQKYQV